MDRTYGNDPAARITLARHRLSIEDLQRVTRELDRRLRALETGGGEAPGTDPPAELAEAIARCLIWEMSQGYVTLDETNADGRTRYLELARAALDAARGAGWEFRKQGTGGGG